MTKVAGIFTKLQEGVKAGGPALVKQVKGIIQFEILEPGFSFVVDLKNGNGDVYQGKAKTRATVTITVTDDDFGRLVDGSLNPQQAFMQSKIKIKGNMGLAMKLPKVLAAAQ